MALMVKPPNSIYGDEKTIKIFFAGSIEMGQAEDWQNELFNAIEDIDNVLIYNPRRDDWDSSWKQDITNDNFNEQVTWELDHIEQSDIVIFYFDPNTKSPITLLELGMVSQIKTEAIVCCPEGFWRKGNVQIVCERYGIDLVDTKSEVISRLKSAIENQKYD